MQVVELPHAALGFDSWSGITAAQYADLRKLGFVFAVRYLDNLTVAEIGSCLDSGLKLALVQASRKPGWRPGPAFGTEDGARARRQAIALGIPFDADIFCDLETPDPATTTAADVDAYARAYCPELVSGGYHAKVYIGSGLPPKLDEVALYKLPYTGYWSSFSRVSDVASRGYQMRQLFFYPTGECKVVDVFPQAPASVAGLRIDADIASSDYKGGRVRALAA
jgi:hypothetical protein